MRETPPCRLPSSLKPPFPSLQRCRQQQQQQQHRFAERSEKSQPTAFPPVSIPLHTAFSASLSNSDRYGTRSTQVPDRGIHPLRSGGAGVGPERIPRYPGPPPERPQLWSRRASGARGVRSSMAAAVRQTEVQRSSGCRVLLTVCLSGSA